tara:strand:- start:991 stop:1629 length:639 start_codon:yes stop_codon:yes gene_type:complete
MPRISRIAIDEALSNSDKLLGTDVSGSTKNFTLAQLGSFTKANYSNVDIANGADNRIITASDADSLNGEANLTFDGSTLALTGSGTVSSDFDVTGSVKITQNLRRTITTVTPSSGVSTISLIANDNFVVNLTNESSSLVMTIASENVGQSGVIILKNPSSVGSFTMAALPSNMLTPAGASVNFTISANDTSVISYVVISSTQALVNYVGEFS